jgi:hypothetical protein
MKGASGLVFPFYLSLGAMSTPYSNHQPDDFDALEL